MISKRTIDASSKFDLEDVLAVIVDTNGVSKALPDIDQLARLASDLNDEDIELVLPEVVVWELAEHVAAALEKLRAPSRSAARTAEKAGIDLRAVAIPSRDEILTSVINDLSSIPHATILELDGEFAKAAIEDQVLQTGAGSTKEGVKTGAADSAWLRGVHDDYPNAGSIVIVSSDKGVRAAAQALWGSSPPFVSDLYSLRSVLLAHPVDLAVVTPEVWSFLGHAIDAKSGRRVLDLGNAELDDPQLSRLFGSFGEWLVQVDTDVTAHGPVLGAAQVAAKSVTGTVSAVMYIGASIDITGWYLNNDGELEQIDDGLVDAVIRSEMVFSRDGAYITAGQNEGSVEVLDDESIYPDPSDAAVAVIEVLGLLPGWRDLDDLAAGEEGTAHGDIDGASWQLDISGTANGWGMTLSSAGRADVTLICVTDDLLAHPSGSDRSGEPCRLVAIGDAPYDWNPLWSLNAAISAILLDKPSD